ncbi:MAG: hypothetical protein DCC65_02015 [Planctomycetota bacterium]|nr:MAG: hypothetical protein DCC65_02015 [Planctomycetota bacterium]
MAAKEDRQAAIRRLVAEGTVATQAQMRKALKARGMAVDQSTLSRDFIELGIRKVAGKYIVDAVVAPPVGDVDLSALVVRWTTCGPHQIVMHTTIGQAQGVSIAIDQKAEPAIVATLAGDDTILVLTKSRRSQAVVLRRLAQWFGDKHEA